MTGSGAVHVTTQRRHYTGKDGRERVYETHLLRRSWREDGKVRNETVANLSKLPADASLPEGAIVSILDSGKVNDRTLASVSDDDMVVLRLDRSANGFAETVEANPDKVAALKAAGVKVTGRLRHAFPENEHNRGYLETKAKRAGHLL